MKNTRRFATMIEVTFAFIVLILIARFLFRLASVFTLPAIILELLIIVVCCILVWIAY